MKFDFSGYATRNNLKCSDGRTIMPDAFKDQDHTMVPLIWNHGHNSVDNVLGHALLENRPDGVYAYGIFNDTESGRAAKKVVENGDVKSLSIFANKLKHDGNKNVLHGAIREVSLVLAGANPGAYIESVLTHSDGSYEELAEDECIIHTYWPDEESLRVSKNDYEMEETKELSHAEESEEKVMANSEKTVQDVIDSMTEEQKTVMYALVGASLDSADDDYDDYDDEDEGDDDMKHNVFDGAYDEYYDDDDVLTHSEMQTIIEDGKRFGSLKESFLAHADDYGIQEIETLFPEPTNLNNPPMFIKRDMDWVGTVMSEVHHSPFSRIKSSFANITEDEARAKGYIKGKRKKEEVFSLLKRTTTPTTIYKKQKLDRDDVVDITDFDVVSWIKGEMRMMLDEEIARSILVSDGRLVSSDDKIDESHIRPIWTDDDLFTIKALVNNDDAYSTDKKRAFINTCIRARKDYKGTGNPVLFTTEDVVTDLLLMTDTTGRDLFDSLEKLATKLRVSRIISVPVMEGLSRKVDGRTHKLMAIIVNLNDYNVGADKGGSINMFDDFDIDYNQMKYLMETRCSGALTVPYSAIAVEEQTTAVAGA